MIVLTIAFGTPIAIYLFQLPRQRAAIKAAQEKQFAQKELAEGKLIAIAKGYSSLPNFSLSKRLDGIDLFTSLAIPADGTRISLIDLRGEKGYCTIYPGTSMLDVQIDEDFISWNTTKTDRHDQSVKTGVGRILSGETGALIGGLSATQITTSTNINQRIELRITVEDMHRPVWRLTLTNWLMNKDSALYLHWKDQAQQWEGALKGVMQKARREGVLGTPPHGFAAHVSGETHPIPPPPPPLPALPAECAYHVAREGVDLGEKPLSKIRSMLASGELTANRDFYYHLEAEQWEPLTNLNV